MQILRLDHVQLSMPSGGESEARRFYRDLLGIAEIPKPPDLAQRGGCWFEHGAVKVHLGVDADFRPARRAHPGFLVADLGALAQRLRAAGFRVEDDERVPGVRRAFVDDPFGNRIELIAVAAA